MQTYLKKHIKNFLLNKSCPLAKNFCNFSMGEPVSKEKKASTTRRDRLIELEAEAQTIWDHNKFYESNPKENTPNKKKYFITFPYPYMNGTLHLGHAFSMSKCEFTARYKRFLFFYLFCYIIL